MPADRVYVYGLKVDTVIGAYDWEKTVLQTLLIDLELWHDNRPAGLSDDLTQALDYDAISQRISALLRDSARELIERVAEDIATLLFAEFNVQEACVTVHKPCALANAADVAVKIHRRSDGQ